MTSTGKAASVLVALAIIAAVGVGAVYLGAEAVGYLPALPPDTVAMLIAVLLAALIVAGALRSIGAAIGAGRLRLERKAEAYARVLAQLCGGTGGPAETDAAAEWARARTAVALWGSVAVVRQLAAIEAASSPADGGERADGAAVESLLREMRQDLGLVNYALKAGELAGLVHRPGQGPET